MVGLLRGKWTDFFSFSEAEEDACLRDAIVVGGDENKIGLLRCATDLLFLLKIYNR